jgi:hypothetical protein
VDITDSPQKEKLLASDPRVIVPTASKKMTPNYHRRLQNTPHRVITPTTPHHMTRSSAEPLNLSQDMLEETVKQDNHVFFLPIVPSNTQALLQPTKNEQIIIMPEMVNAVFSQTQSSC